MYAYRVTAVPATCTRDACDAGRRVAAGDARVVVSSEEPVPGVGDADGASRRGGFACERYEKGTIYDAPNATIWTILIN